MMDLLEHKEDYNRKLNLLKQIKISMESLMFDNGRIPSRSSMHLSQGILTKFSRNILAILEDGFLVEDTTIGSTQLPFVFSPGDSASSYYETNQSEKSKCIWTFISSILDETDLTQPSSYNEKFVKKEFKQLKEKLSSSIRTYDNSIPTGLQNFAFEWINESMLNFSLLTQLSFMLGDPLILRGRYSPGSFVLDQSFVDDLFTYVIAYEKRDFKILAKVKRIFFSPEIESLNEPKRSHSKSINNSPKNSDSFTASITSTSSTSNDEKNSLIERAVMELNVNKLKHRRLNSFPSIQINLAKKNLALAALMNEKKEFEATNSSVESRSAYFDSEESR